MRKLRFNFFHLAKVVNLAPFSAKLTLPTAVQNMLYYGLGLFLMKGISLIMLPFLTHVLTMTQIGKLELLASLSTALGILIHLALTEVLYRFAGEQEGELQYRTTNQLFTMSFCVGVGGSLCVWLARPLVFSFFPQITPNQWMILSVGLIFDSALGMALAWLRMQGRAKTFMLVTVSCCCLQITLICCSIMLERGVAGILLASVIAHAIELMVLIKIGRLRWQRPQLLQLKTWLIYALPMMGAAACAFCLNGAEKWILADALDLKSLAIYGVAIKFALAMCILVQPFSMWWMPKRFHQLTHVGDDATMRITQYGLLWIMLLMIVMGFAVPIFIQIALPSHYAIAGQYVLLALSTAMCKEMVELVNVGMLYQKRTTWLLVINAVAATLGVGLALALRHHGVWGILIAMQCAHVIRLISVFVLSQYFHVLGYHYKSMLLLLTFSLLSLVVAYYINSLLLLACSALVFPCVFYLIAWQLGVAPRFNVGQQALIKEGSQADVC